MTKADLVQEISKQTGIDRNEVLMIVEAFMETVKGSLSNGKNVYLRMKDLFNSEQLEALRHHFPNISKAMEEGKDLLKQITRSRGFGMGM